MLSAGIVALKHWYSVGSNLTSHEKTKKELLTKHCNLLIKWIIAALLDINKLSSTLAGHLSSKRSSVSCRQTNPHLCIKLYTQITSAYVPTPPSLNYNCWNSHKYSNCLMALSINGTLFLHSEATDFLQQQPNSPHVHPAGWEPCCLNGLGWVRK